MLPVKQAELDGTDDVDINHMTQAHANSYRYVTVSFQFYIIHIISPPA